MLGLILPNVRVGLISLLLSFVCLFKIHAQDLQLEVYMNPNPSPFIFNWGQESDLININAFNSSSSSIDVKFSVQIQNGFMDLVAGTDVLSAQSYTLLPGLNDFSGTDIFSVSEMIFSDSYERIFRRVRMLPEDNYRIVISVLDAQSGLPLTEIPFTADFFISGIGASYLIYPGNGQWFTPEDLANMVFQWTPSYLDPSHGYFDYQLIMVEVLENQTPEEAISVNEPVLEECYSGMTTQFLWPEDLVSLIPGLYAWSVRIVQYCGQYILSDYSEVATINVGSTRTRTPRDSTRTRPPDDDDPRDAPPPTIYGEEIDPDQCSEISYEVKKGTPISLGMILKEKSKFEYPRAVPLRAEGIDYDLVKFYCYGCDSQDTSIFNYVVRDNVINFKWEILSGPGSLNTLPEVQKIDSLQSKINELEGKLNEINDSLKQIHTDTTVTIPDKIEDLKNKIKESERVLKDKDSLLIFKTKQMDSLDVQMQLAINKISTFQDNIEKINEKIKENLSKIDSTETDLKGEPGPEEKAQQDVVAQILEEQDEKAAQLVDMDSRIVDESERLTKLISDAEANLQSILETYNRLNGEVEAISGNIVTLETMMMRDSTTREFMQLKKDWRQKSIQFIFQYYGSSNKKKYYEQQKDIEHAAGSTLSLLNEAERQDQKARFNDLMIKFNDKLSGFCKRNNSACENALSLVMLSGDQLQQHVEKLSLSDYKFDQKTQNTIDSLRRILEILEADLLPLKQQLDQAQQDYMAALNAYNDGMIELQEEKSTILDELGDINQRLLKAEERLNKLIEKRINKLERNREKYIKRLHQLRLDNSNANAGLEANADSLLRYQTDTTKIRIELELLSRELEQLEVHIRAIQKAIDRFKQQLEVAEGETEKLREQAKELEEDRDDIQKDIDDLKKQLDQLKKTKNNKEAKGLQVYYIPPTLEEILQLPDTFNIRKKRVSDAEAQLDKAYAQKEAVPEKLVKLMDQVSKDLIKYKTASDQIPGLVEEIKKLSDDITKDKTRKAQDFLVEQQKAQDKIKDKSGDVDSLNLILEDLLKDSTKIADEIKEFKEKIEEEDSLLTAKRTALLEKMTELENEKKLLKNAENTLETRQNELTTEKVRLDGLQEDLAKERNGLTRANAKEDEALVNDTKQKIEQLNADIKLSKDTKIPSIEQKIASTSGSVKSAQQRVETVDKQKEDAWKEWNDVAQNLDGALRDSINAKNERLEKILSSIERQRKLKKKSEEELDKATKDRSKTQGDVNDKINNEETIKSKTASLEGLKKKLEAAKAERTKLENAVQEALNKKEKLIKDAKEALKKAKENLDQREKELQDYLRDDEFNVVDITVELKLTADDEEVDQWREVTDVRDADPTAELIKILKYPKTRIPQLVGGNTKAQDNKPGDQNIPAACNAKLSFEKDPGPEKNPSVIQTDNNEPRTIALKYKDGEPLWKEWPIIPDEAPLLSKEVIRLVAGFKPDFDQIQYQCTTLLDCDTFPSQGPDMIKDLGTFKWKAVSVHSHHEYFTDMFWETPKINKPKDKDGILLEPKYNPSEIVKDDEVKGKVKIQVQAGYMIETTKEIIGVPDTSLEVRGRVVTGDHKGLEGEEIEFSVALVAGESKGFGFDGAASTVTVPSDGDGYANTKFNFGDGFAEFEITIKWLRGGKAIQTETCTARAPISIALHRFSSSVPEFAWKATKKLFKDGGSAEDAIKDFPDSEGDEGKGAYAAPIHGIAGLQDAEKDFVNDENVSFSISPDSIKVDPEQALTELYGIGRTTIKELPEDISVTLTAEVEEKYKDVGEPAKDEKDYSTKKSQKFRIGSESSMFVVVMDEPFNPNEPVNGSGKLELDIGQGNIDILSALKEIKLTASDVELEGAEDDFTAIAGKVYWGAGGNPIKRTILGFEFSMDSLVITTTAGAGLGGDVKKDSLIKNPVKFYVEVEPSGDFLGTLSNIPSLGVKGFTLKEGSAFTIDWHSNNSAGSFAKTFKGVVIHSAMLELPEQFSKGDEKSSLSVSEFYIGTDLGKNGNSSMGFGGEISYEGTMLKTGFAGYDLSANKFVLGFDHSTLTKAEIEGELALPMPMEGKISTTIGWAEEKFAATLATENPVAIPRLGVTMSLKTGCGLSYDTKKKVGALRLNTFMVSQKFGEVDINGFEINSEGFIKADEITVNKAIEFGSGFDLYVETLGFKIASKEYSFKFDGGFSFPRIGIDQMMGSVELAPGPTIDILFKNASIKFEKGPVAFDGEFAYSSSEFKGDFKIGIKKVLPSGIEGMIVVGNTKDAKDIDYSYWYTQLAIGAKIPIAQTGISVLKMGGGLGYNYNPPIGVQEGSPSHNNSFSFKAIMGMGNTPGGELFEGRLEMVLVPGKFSLYGKTWLLSQEDALYGDGQINLMWDPRVQIDGYSRMFIGIPNAEGKILYFNGKVNFLYSPNDFYIRSEKLEGSLLKVIKAEGLIDVTEEHLKLKGKLGYSLDKEIELAVVTAIVDIAVSADMEVLYVIKSKSLDASAGFHGHWDVDLDTPMGTADIISGNLNIDLGLKANPSFIEVKGKAGFSYDVWVYDGDVDVDITYKSNF